MLLTELKPGQALGFIIEDTKDAPFVMQDVKRVNLYAYMSAAVALLQKQQEEIASLQKEVEALRKKSTVKVKPGSSTEK